MVTENQFFIRFRKLRNSLDKQIEQLFLRRGGGWLGQHVSNVENPRGQPVGTAGGQGMFPNASLAGQVMWNNEKRSAA